MIIFTLVTPVMNTFYSKFGAGHPREERHGNRTRQGLRMFINGRVVSPSPDRGGQI